MASYVRIIGGLLVFNTLLLCAGDIPRAEQFPSDKHYRITARHIERGGIGYNHGYTTLDGFFAPDPQSLSIMPFLDVRGHVFDNGKLAANIGTGLRKIIGCRVYGFNAYYDFRNSPVIHYNQIGFGFETLGRWWDFRINGYIPVGKKITPPCDSKFDRFIGHRMILAQKYNVAMDGFNAEVGFHFGKTRHCDFYLAGGPYYFAAHNNPKTWGGKVRLICRLTDYITIELSNIYDKLFRDRFQGQISINIPFGGRSCTDEPETYCSIPNILFSRMAQPVIREEIIVVGPKNKHCAAIDPRTGKPYNFVFVDNTSHSDGTFEHPYPTLALAQANSTTNDVIYVFPGDGTTKGMDSGIVLQPHQKLWGAGINHAIKTTQGDFTIPALSSSTPTITNTGGDGITLSPVNEISGFIITDVTGYGVTGSILKNIDIGSCTFTNSQLDQINLTYDYPWSTTTLSLHDLTISNGQEKGIVIDNSTRSATSIIKNCSIHDNQRHALDANFSGNATLYLNDTTIDRNSLALDNNCLITCAASSSLVISGNTFSNTPSINYAPLTIIGNAGPLYVTVENNTFNNNTTGATHIVMNNTNLALLTINNNTFSHNNSGAVSNLGSPLWIDPNNTIVKDCRISLLHNTFANNAQSSLYCYQGTFNNLNVVIAENTLSNNGSNDIVFTAPCTALTVNATNNNITNCGGHAFSTAETIGLSNITISHNTITGNGGNALALSHSGTTFNIQVSNNTLSNNSESGLIMYSAGINNVTVTIDNNVISNNQNINSNASGGIDLEQYIDTLSGSITNNTLLNNVGSGGVYINSDKPSPVVCVTMSGNNSNNDYTLVNNTGTFNVAPCNVHSLNTGTINTTGTITVVQSCPNGSAC